MQNNCDMSWQKLPKRFARRVKVEKAATENLHFATKTRVVCSTRSMQSQSLVDGRSTRVRLCSPLASHFLSHWTSGKRLPVPYSTDIHKYVGSGVMYRDRMYIYVGSAERVKCVAR